MSELDQELSDVFRAELSASLDGLATQVGRLERSKPGDAGPILQDSMRIAHNVKGAARVVGFQSVADLAHALEDVLGAIAEAPERATAEVLAGLDHAISRLESFAEGDGSSDDGADFCAELRALVPDAVTDAEAPGRAPEAPEAPDASNSSAANGGCQTTPGAPEEGPRNAGGEETLRVHVHRLDRLMAATGELLTAQDRLAPRAAALDGLRDELTALGRRVEGEAGARLRELIRRLGGHRREDREELRRMSYLADEMREAMRRVRMIPIAALVPVWRRVVREAAHDNGKSVRLVAEIGDVEIDRTILDALRDPLTHLLRNAVGHGLEARDDRGDKPACGTVRVRAGLSGGSVRLEISDDGRGLDADALRDRAVEVDLLSRDEARALSDAEALDLVFRPGFSTARVADQVSGRGVGLDIVRGRIRSFGGSVEIRPHGELGGAEFLLTVPASLVSLRGLDVRCGDTTVVVPVDAVERTTRVRAEELRQVDGGTAVPYGDGEPIRVRHLGRLLGVSRSRDARGWLPVVVVQSSGRRQGLLVDEILGEGDHVTGSLPWCFGKVVGVAGATILGSGRVAPVADVAGLFSQRSDDAGIRAATPGRRPKILVVDDSVTSRTLEKNILQAAGYDVTTGVDGLDGWSKLQDGGFDLLVTDIEMPRLDGLGLTRKVRGEERFRNLPVIIVSSLGSREDLDTGASAGADEYLVKRQFDQRALLDAVSRHVP